MERRIFAVLVLMAAIAAFGSERSAQSVGFDVHYFNGPVCYPGDPCGPGVVLAPEPRNVSGVETFGPVCYPGDPCGWPGVVHANRVGIGNWSLNGPVCYPGDPCGPQPVTLKLRLASLKFNGPVCYPGDPCGPGGRS